MLKNIFVLVLFMMCIIMTIQQTTVDEKQQTVISQNENVTSNNVPEQCTYGYFYLTYKHKTAAEAVFNRVRDFYPNAPIYIYTDLGGVDLSHLCIDDNYCKVVMSDIRYGHNFQSDNRVLKNTTIVKVNTFFNHFAEAVKWKPCEFLVYIETDIWMQNQYTELDYPQGDVGGIWNPWYPIFHKNLQDWVKVQSGAQPMSVARVIFGASYYRTPALLDCIERVLPKIDWYIVHKLDPRVPINWDTVPPVLFALGGYEIAPWHAACEKEHRYFQYTKRNCSDAPLRHKNNPASSLYKID